MEKFITVNGCSVRVRDSVTGSPVIVLLHGYLDSMEVWEDFIPLLDGVRIIRIDLPGHGKSEIKGEIHTMEFFAKTVRGVLAALGIERCFIVGHSMGGYVALELLKHYPEICQGIVLLHSTPNADKPEKKETREQEINLVLSGKKESIAHTIPVARFAPQNRKRMTAKIEEISNGVLMMENEGITAALRGMAARSDNNEVLQKSAVPQLFILGREDGHIPGPVADKMIADHPQAQVVFLEHSGHMGFMEEPQLTAQTILDFVNRYM